MAVSSLGMQGISPLLQLRAIPPRLTSSGVVGAASPSDEPSGSLLVDFAPCQMAIAMTTAPRGVPTLEASLSSLRQGQFSQEIYLFTEPGTLPAGWSRPGVVVHQNKSRLGCYPNWLQAARWLLSETDCPYLFLLEDDGVYCRCAAPALYYGLMQLDSVGCLSLYTPLHNYLSGGHSEVGWFPLHAADRWGSVAQCFHRDVLEQFLQAADWSQSDGTDRHVEAFVDRRRLRWYCHAPSLADHIGTCSTMGHPTSVANAGIGFHAEFDGYRLQTPNPRIESSAKSFSDEPEVSIVLPVYNGERYLRESIDSCLQQSLTNWELILVDDGSTDGTDEIIRSYGDPRLVSIRHSRNRRLPAALSTGFRQSRGRFLTWTSCDNRYAPQALETMAKFLRSHPETGLVYTDFQMIDANGQRLNHVRTGPTSGLPAGNVIGLCFLYRRAVYEALGDYDDEAFLAEDYDYWLRAAQIFELTHLPRTLYEFRQHADSLTSRFAKQIPTVAQRVRERNLGSVARENGYR